MALRARLALAVSVVFGVPVAVTAAQTGSGRSTETGLVKVRGGELYYEARGAGAVVVLLHGGLLDGRMWDEQFELLSEECRVIRFDARGHGRSSVPTGDFSNYEDLHDLLVALGVPQATLVGLSLGGRTAIDFALAYPAMVTAVVAVAPGLSGWTFDDPFLAENDRSARAAKDPAGIVEAFQRSWTDGPKRTPQQVDPVVRGRVQQMALENLTKAFASRGELKEMGAAGRLGELRVPLLAIVGDLDVSDIHRIVDQLVTNVPGARKVVIAGAGHVVNLERPSEFNRALLEFLRRRPTARRGPRRRPGPGQVRPFGDGHLSDRLGRLVELGVSAQNSSVTSARPRKSSITTVSSSRR
jgi:pimeloyl-ACP methyl ester carboxylesterase